ncbi:MAG: 50S ribosomal protein L29 [Gemmatimonadaceae bacterium]
MLAEEIREMTDPEIRARIGELEEERFRLKFRSATATLEDPLRLRVLRKDIARLQTIARERALGVRRPGAGGEAGADESRKAATSARKGDSRGAKSARRGAK